MERRAAFFHCLLKALPFYLGTAVKAPVASVRHLLVWVLCFSLQDDVLDLYGQKGRQMAGMDICEGKVSALVVRHVEAKPEQRDLLLSILRLPREETTEAHIAQMSQAFKDSGALDWVLEDIHQLNQAVQSDQYLHRHPQLFALAQELCNVALKPIQFMF